MTTREKIIDWSIPEPNSGCWLWAGYVKANGYGQHHSDGKTTYAHRDSYRVFRGEIPDGLTIDHLCRNRSCVNPDHLEPVTQRENNLRGETMSAIHARKTHCPYGHSLIDPDNVKRDKRGQRRCKACDRMQHNRRYPQRIAKIREARTISRQSLDQAS